MTEPPIDDRLAEFTGDPRDANGFEPGLFPLCDGAAVADGAPDTPIGRNRLHFLAIYYRLNEAYNCLEGLPAHDCQARADPLQNIRHLTLARDRLEDLFSPYGFIGEPEFEDGIARNIVFTEPPQRFVESKNGGMSSFCISYSLPDPRQPELAAGE